MTQIAICDDDFQVCDQLEDCIRRWKGGRRLEVEVFDTGKEFEEAFKERRYDLIFLDIMMRDRGGIKLGGFIREELGNDASMIIYISAYGGEYVLNLFQFQPFHFLKRPIRPGDFQSVLYKAYEKIEGDAEIFGFESSWAVYRVPLKDILYFEGDNRRIEIVTADHTYHCYSTLENLFSRINMEEASFMRLHKLYAVSLRYVTIFSVRMVTLFDGSEFMVSTPFKENALRRYKGYISKTGVRPGNESEE